MFKRHRFNQGFISDLDRLISEFDRNHEPTKPQKHEIDKYRHLNELRDNAHEDAILKPYEWDQHKLWKDF
jgi:hypothetical protein